MAQRFVKHWFIVFVLCAGALAEVHSQEALGACDAVRPACVASCARFDATDTRFDACRNVCRREALDAAQCAAEIPEQTDARPASQPEPRAYARKGDALRERELNGRMIEAIERGELEQIRRLVEMNKGLNPTYAYDFDFDPQTRRYEGRAVKLRLADLFRDTNPNRRDEEGLDRMLALFIELGMDVGATLPPPSSEAALAARGRSAWGPSLAFMESARDRDARLRAFAIALENGLQPNDDLDEWLFAELPQVCGRDRSQFAIQVVDLLVTHLGASLQDDFWRIGERGPETVADVLDRSMSPGREPRSHSERAQFAIMDQTWENCAPLSRRINRYLKEGR